MQEKTHYKMFKSGKTWLFTAIATFAVAGAAQTVTGDNGFIQPNLVASADDNGSNQEVTGKWGDVDYTYSPSTKTMTLTGEGTISQRLKDTQVPKDVKVVDFQSHVSAGESAAEMFAGYSDLNIRHLENLNTSQVKDMSRMFFGVDLKDTNFSKFDTSAATSMRFMFVQAKNLRDLNLTNFNTKNVTDMKAMFLLTSGVSNLDLSSFDTQNVTDDSGMFNYMKGKMFEPLNITLPAQKFDLDFIDSDTPRDMVQYKSANNRKGFISADELTQQFKEGKGQANTYTWFTKNETTEVKMFINIYVHYEDATKGADSESLDSELRTISLKQKGFYDADRVWQPEGQLVVEDDQMPSLAVPSTLENGKYANPKCEGNPISELPVNIQEEIKGVDTTGFGVFYRMNKPLRFTITYDNVADQSTQQKEAEQPSDNAPKQEEGNKSKPVFELPNTGAGDDEVIPSNNEVSTVTNVATEAKKTSFMLPNTGKHAKSSASLLIAGTLSLLSAVSYAFFSKKSK